MDVLAIGRMDSFIIGSTIIPIETPVGVLNGSTQELLYRGEVFHQIDNTELWLNVNSGDVVKIDFNLGDLK